MQRILSVALKCAPCESSVNQLKASSRFAMCTLLIADLMIFT